MMVQSQKAVTSEHKRGIKLDDMYQDCGPSIITRTYLLSFLGDITGNLEGRQVFICPVLLLLNTFL
jgi:hypothetical protein